ncbi:amidohydrolase family protein [Luteibacter sp. PPL201]|uniref:Amidohydrolase family protein n=1 Tax=Luteibacter sahnii TaxID=3021977 RepID=A0ABT6B653_9GAMM
MDVTLHGAGVVRQERPVRGTLHLRAGRVADTSAGGFAVDLRDHLVFPGLINAHEHLHVNAVPPLPMDRPFANSYDWMAAFQAHFDEPAVKAALARPKACRMRHGALKNLLAGTTVVAHHDPWDTSLDDADFPVALLRGYGWAYTLNGPAFGPDVRASFLATPPSCPWMIHLAEGTDERARQECAQLDAMGCLAAHSVLVHGVGLDAEGIDAVIARGASVVWCPASNRRLLGRTLDTRRLHAAGRLGLGSDSRVSGSRDLLDELGVAVDAGLTPHEAWVLATAANARILRMPWRGHLGVGATADLVIVADRGDAARSLVGLRRADLRAVVREGRPCVADPDFAPWFEAAGVDAVAVELDGRPKLLDRRFADPTLLALEPGLVGERVH